MRASAVVKRQSVRRTAALRVATQAATSLVSVAWSSSRRSRHCRWRVPSSISAMFSQLPCFGVWWISSRSANRLVSAGGKASYSETGVWMLRLSMTSTMRSACG